MKSRLERQGKDFLKSISNSLINSYTPVVPLETIPDIRQKWAKSIDRKGAKTLPFRAAHTSMAYIMEYPPGAFRYTAVSGARVRLKVPAPIHANLFSQRPAERPGITSVVPFILIDCKRTPSPVFVPVSRNGNLNPSQPVFGMSRFKKWRTFKKWL